MVQVKTTLLNNYLQVYEKSKACLGLFKPDKRNCIAFSSFKKQWEVIRKKSGNYQKKIETVTETSVA